LKRSPPSSTVRRLRSKRKVALVCAGGGVTGAVYEIGCLRAIEDLLDRSVLDFDTYVGVSGGAFVASLLASGISPAEIYAEVTAPSRHPLGLSDAPLFRLGLSDVLQRLRRAPRVLSEAVASLARGESRGLADSALSLLELLPAGLLDNSGVQEWLARLWAERGLGDRFEDLQRELFIVAVDLDSGEAVAFGGRILPGSTDPAKYKNSPETEIYRKSRVLYGLSWAKSDIVKADRVVVCEGYTDVIGFHQAGVPIAVATCGTALTADHVRLLKRFASRVVLAFDADAAGQGAAERFYEWERQFDVTVEVARLPRGQDPAELAGQDPEALRRAVEEAEPFLGFRVGRVLRAGGRVATPEAKAKLANSAMAMVSEHPDVNVRKLYAGQVAQHTGLPVADLVKVAERRAREVEVRAAPDRPAMRENAEFVVLALLVQRWDEVAPWLVEPLFSDETNLGAFRVLAHADGDVHKAIEQADPEVRDLLERVSVADVEADSQVEVRNLVGAATRRELEELRASRDLSRNAELVATRRLVEQLDDPEAGWEAAGQLLRWLAGRPERRREELG
jgi:DNA primase